MVNWAGECVCVCGSRNSCCKSIFSRREVKYIWKSWRLCSVKTMRRGIHTLSGNVENVPNLRYERHFCWLGTATSSMAMMMICRKQAKTNNTYRAAHTHTHRSGERVKTFNCQKYIFSNARAPHTINRNENLRIWQDENERKQKKREKIIEKFYFRTHSAQLCICSFSCSRAQSLRHFFSAFSGALSSTQDCVQ